MSRVHDALRRASQDKFEPVRTTRSEPRVNPRVEEPPVSARVEPQGVPASSVPATAAPAAVVSSVAVEPQPPLVPQDLEGIILAARQIPYNPQKDALIVNLFQPREAPAEEFRTLRTRLNHLQQSQPIHTLVITSASPAEGKSFTATNLAISQAQLADKRILLADFDFRRPTLHNTFQIPCCPGITDYLTGKAAIQDVLCRIKDTNLYLLPAGEAVPNPLELLNLRECRSLIEELRNHFDWVILDSPPLLFAADGNLLATMCDGTILVVRIGTTTFDSVGRAMQSLCENNVLGVVVNGARRGELYSKYSYYYDYYSADDSAEPEGDTESREAEVVPAGASS